MQRIHIYTYKCTYIYTYIFPDIRHVLNSHKYINIYIHTHIQSEFIYISTITVYSLFFLVYSLLFVIYIHIITIHLSVHMSISIL